MKLQILISTIDNNIEKIGNIIIPYRQDVEYIVSHQYQSEKYLYTPSELLRNDIKVSHIKGKGLSISRNHAISLASDDGICLISDDDVQYENEYFDTILNIFHTKNPDIALFKIRTNEGEEEYKDYPLDTYKLELDHMHGPSSIEIAFRANRVRNKLNFDTRFGLGTKLIGGEELIFIKEAIQNNLNVWYYPKYIVRHPKESSIKSYPKYHEKRTLVIGGIDAKINGWFSIIRSIAFFFILFKKLVKHKKCPLIYLENRIRGNLHILLSR